MNARAPELLLARAARLRQMMRQADCPALVIVDPVNILYATGATNMSVWGMRTPARYLVVFADGPSILYDFRGCAHLAAGLPTIDDIRQAEGLDHVSSGAEPAAAAARFAAAMAGLMAEHAPGETRLAIDRLPYHTVDALRARGLVLGDADAIFAAARRIKLAVELPYIREAVARVERAAGELEAAIRPGLTEIEIWAGFHRRFIAEGGAYVSTRLLQSGAATFPYFQEAGTRVVAPGELICFDTDVTGYAGYAVDFSRTFRVGGGRPSADQRTLYARAREQLAWNADLIRPGVAFADIAARAWTVPEEHRQSRYYCIGHGLGMSGEHPNIPHLEPGKPYPLPGAIEPGMIICVESYVGSAASGQGVKLEDQLLVTETGVETLSGYRFDDDLQGRMV
jgi:Xaa-Pro aminopeptidase